jgi:hypothetical protein
VWRFFASWRTQSAGQPVIVFCGQIQQSLFCEPISLFSKTAAPICLLSEKFAIHLHHDTNTASIVEAY